MKEVMSPRMRRLQEERYELACEFAALAHTLIRGDFLACEMDQTQKMLVAKSAELAHLTERIREQEYWERPREDSNVHPIEARH